MESTDLYLIDPSNNQEVTFNIMPYGTTKHKYIYSINTYPDNTYLKVFHPYDLYVKIGSDDIKVAEFSIQNQSPSNPNQYDTSYSIESHDDMYFENFSGTSYNIADLTIGEEGIIRLNDGSFSGRNVLYFYLTR